MDKQELVDSIEFIFDFVRASRLPEGAVFVLHFYLEKPDDEAIHKALVEQEGAKFMDAIASSPRLLAARRSFGDDARPTYQVLDSPKGNSQVAIALLIAPPPAWSSYRKTSTLASIDKISEQD